MIAPSCRTATGEPLPQPPSEPGTYRRAGRRPRGARLVAAAWLACLGLVCLLSAPSHAADAAASTLALFDSAAAAVRDQFFDPRLNGVSLDTIVAYRQQNLGSHVRPSNLETEVNGLLSELHYAGGRFYRTGQAPDFSPAFLWRDTREGIVVSVVQPGSECERAGLLVGNLVLTPRGDLWGPRGSSVTLRVRGDAGEWSHPVAREGYGVPEGDFGWKSYASGRVGYLRARRIQDVAAVDTVMGVMSRYSDLILDVRYCRDSDPTVLRLLSYFATTPSAAGYAVNRIGMARQGSSARLAIPAGVSENTGMPWLFNPVLSERGLVALRVLPNADSTFKGRVIVLADENTRGFAELIPAWFRAEKRATIVGRPTAGRGGLVATLQMTPEWTLELPTAALFHADGVPLESHGIEPNYFMQWTQLDVRVGGDPDVERALQLFDADE